MGKYKLELEVINSGSPNGLPKVGHASECYLTFGYITADRPDEVQQKTLFFADIANNNSYELFSEIVDDNKSSAKGSIELPISEGDVLFITFSTFWGSRAFEAAFSQLLQKAVSVAFDKLGGKVSTIISFGAAADIITGQMNKIKKQIQQEIRDTISDNEDIVSVDTFSGLSSLVNGQTETFELFSDISRYDDDDKLISVIQEGELVAKVKLGMA